MLIETGDVFGTSEMKLDQVSYRQFSVQCLQDSQFIVLTLKDLIEMRVEFPEVARDLLKDQFIQQWLLTQVKERALKLLA